MKARNPGLALLLAALVGGGGARESAALIVFDARDSGDNSRNVIVPGDPGSHPDGAAAGVPWRHVVRYGVGNASAVYLGHGFILTANHVIPVEDSDLLIEGVAYARDSEFPPLRLVLPDDGGALALDLRLERIVGDPGLAPLALAADGVNARGKASVLVGWGVGKGALLPERGWEWGDDASRALRWGTNRTTNQLQTVNDMVSLRTDFNSNQGADEAAATLGDSGGALFQNHSGSWLLAGVIFAVSSNGGPETTVYDTNTFFPGDQNADRAFSVRLGEYAWLLRFDHWKDYHGIAAATPDDDDSDGDRVPLLLEYALGMDPTVAARDGLPRARHAEGSLILEHTRLASATDVALEVETSTTLDADDWQPAAATTSVTDDSTVIQRVETSVPDGGAGRLFARLKARRL